MAPSSARKPKLDPLPSPAAGDERELIGLFEDSPWRATRIEILGELGRHPTQRTLEFIFKTVMGASGDRPDIPMAEAALHALGQTRHPLAARFLTRFYPGCDELLKAAAVGAIGQIPDRTLARELLADLTKVRARGPSPWLQNLVLTLGELKLREALPDLESLALSPDPTLALSALVAYGKIARDPRPLERMEGRFRGELFHYQLFASVKTQVQFRARWRLEDYLSRLFTGPGEELHPSLPFELTHFDAPDVEAGLRLFEGPAHFARLCWTLARIDTPEIAGLYERLIPWKKLESSQLPALLDSLGRHWNERLEPLYLRIEPLAREGHAAAWLRAVSLSLPAADRLFKSMLPLAPYAGIEPLNAVVDFGLAAQPVPPKLEQVAALLEARLEDGAESAQLRALRGLGTLGCISKKGATRAAAAIGTKEGAASALFFWENVAPKHPPADWFEKLLAAPAPAARILAVIEHQEKTPATHDGFEALLKSSLRAPDAETRRQALRTLAAHPREAQLDPVLGLFKDPDASVRRAAVIAAKAFGKSAAAGDRVAAAAAPLLTDPDRTVAGRALDTLTAIAGPRAKRLAIDLLKEHPLDLEIAGKVARALQPPEMGQAYFVETVDAVLAAHPQHPLADALIALRERFLSAGGGAPAARIKSAEIAALDRQLGEQLGDYAKIDEAVKTALRSAELPYVHPEMYDEFVDKSSSVIGYCKAIDLMLEKSLGRRALFPKLESQLHEFQNALHALGLQGGAHDERGADPAIALRNLGLEKHFTPQAFPLHKIQLVASSIRTGRIVNEHFKVLDGLRAWAIILLVFARKTPATPRPLVATSLSEEATVQLAKRLIGLQEIRNPAAHRATMVQFKTVDELRREVFQVIQIIQRAF